jgi:hypothetical protein
MKSSTLLITLVFGFLLLSLSSTAQETIWFDSNWNLTVKENAAYYRPSPKKMKNGFWLIDYYRNGTKQMEGFSFISSPNNEKFNGLVHYFFENGKIFQSVNYKSGVIHGARKIYFSSGALKSEAVYEDGKIIGSFSEFYTTGELKETGEYEEGKREEIWKTFYKNGKIQMKGKYREGEKVGVWKTFYKNVY